MTGAWKETFLRFLRGMLIIFPLKAIFHSEEQAIHTVILISNRWWFWSSLSGCFCYPQLDLNYFPKIARFAFRITTSLTDLENSYNLIYMLRQASNDDSKNRYQYFSCFSTSFEISIKNKSQYRLCKHHVPVKRFSCFLL